MRDTSLPQTAAYFPQSDEEFIGDARAEMRNAILFAWQANEISGEDAWGAFESLDLWGSKEEAFHRFAVGCEAFRTQRELWALCPHVRSAAKRIVMLGRTSGALSIDATDWLLDLFAARAE